MSTATNYSSIFSENMTIGRRWCYTTTKLVNFAYTWTVDHYSRRTEKNGQFLASPPFTIPGFDKGGWEVHIYPDGNTQGAKENMSIFLKYNGSDVVWAEGQFSLLSPDGEKPFSRKWSIDFGKDHPDWGFDFFIKKNELVEKYLFHDTLTILCEMSLLKESVHKDGPTPVSTPAFKSISVTQDLGALLRSKKFSDVTFEVDDTEYNAHRNILASRSPVFAGMFENNFLEQKEGRVEVPDVPSDVFFQMLNFIYTDSVPKLKEMAVDLLRVADKYDLKGLKALSEEQLCSDLCIDRACEILQASDLYNAQYLKAYALDYIRVHSNMVVHTDGWKHITKHYPHLVAEAYIVTNT